jgi:cob(I)alamin adenosyltransferase
MKIYTKTGDSGETGLFGGPRVGKDALRIAAYGEVDELNSVLGLARAAALPTELDEVLARLQNQLFDLGAELASPDPLAAGTAILGDAQIAWQEGVIDHWEGRLAPLKQFILPGGTSAAAHLHLARCVCRRAERQVVGLSRKEPVSATALRYLNRLSDLLFVLARAANHIAKAPDVPWAKDAD